MHIRHVRTFENACFQGGMSHFAPAPITVQKGRLLARTQIHRFCASEMRKGLQTLESYYLRRQSAAPCRKLASAGFVSSRRSVGWARASSLRQADLQVAVTWQAPSCSALGPRDFVGKLTCKTLNLRTVPRFKGVVHAFFRLKRWAIIVCPSGTM